MKKRCSPQEKKVQSYVRDGRNMYGESRTSSIKSIRQRKAIVNRHFRRTTAHKIRSTQQSDDGDQVAAIVESVWRKQWKKVPDRSLVEYVERNLQYRDYRQGRLHIETSDLMLEAKRRLSKRRAMYE